MVRSIDSNMQAVINGHTKRPAVTITAEDHILHYSQYQFPNGTDEWNDACIANDGSIVRVRVSRGSFNSAVTTQRITDPSVASQWTTWSGVSNGNANIFQDASCAISNNGGTLRIFVQQGTGGNAIWTWSSTDNGNTWSSQSTVLSPPGGALVRGLGSGGNNDIFFLYDVAGGDQLGASFFNGSSWSALNSSAGSLAVTQSGAGVAVVWNAFGGGQYKIYYSDGYDLFSSLYNPTSNTWGPAENVAPATSTAIARTSPRVAYDPVRQVYMLAVIESDSGILTGSVYSYPRIRLSADIVHWSNGIILHDISGTVTFGANAFYLTAPQSGSSGARYYITTMGYVYTAIPFNQSNSNQFVDLSPAVLSYKRIEKTNKPAEFQMVLDNSKGQYNGLVSTSAGNTQPLGPNTSIVINEGYYVGNPPTTKDQILTAVYHLQQIHFERTPQDNLIRLVGYDKSRLLDYQARFQQTYNNKTVAFLVAEVLGRAGLFNPVISSTSSTSRSVPQFIIYAGRAYRAAMDELCTTYGLYYFCDQNEVMQVRELGIADSSVWTYQPEWELFSYVVNDLRANHIVVSGKPPATGQAGALTTWEQYDDAHVQWVGGEQLLHEVDTKLTTTGQAQLRASLSMQREQRAAQAHVVQVPVNPALQLFDVITVNDYAAPQGSGQSGNARIVESTITFNAEHAEYTQQFALEGV